MVQVAVAHPTIPNGKVIGMITAAVTTVPLVVHRVVAIALIAYVQVADIIRTYRTTQTKLVMSAYRS
mgnify:CR=1 FL=1